MCGEHPLLEYLEDPLVDGDPTGYQKAIKRFGEALPKVKIGVRSWFKSSLETIKQHSQIVSKDGGDDDEEGESRPDTRESNPGSPREGDNKSSQALLELNKLKFIPGVIHIERSLLPKASAYKLWELVQYQ